MPDRLLSLGSGPARARRTIPAGLAAYVLVFALISSSGQVPADVAATLTNVLSFVIILAAAGVIWHLAVRRLDDATRTGWLLVGAALLAFGIGELLWTWLDAMLDTPPVPTVADIGYVLFIPLMLAGVLLVFQPRRRRDQLELLADALAFALVAAALLWMLILQPLLGTTAASPAEAAVLVLYPASDVVLVLAVVLGFLSRSRLRTTAAVTFAAGMLLFLVGDLVYASLSLDASYQSGSFWDVGWSLGALLVAWSCAIASEGTDRAPVAPRGPTWGSAVLLIAPIVGFLVVDQLATPTSLDTITRLAPIWVLLLLAALIGGVRVAYLVHARAVAATTAERMAAELAKRNRELAARYRSLAEVDRLKDELIVTAEEASRAKTAFLAAMSHEIRTPLHGIIGSLELLRDLPVDAPVSAQLEVIGRAAERQLRIVDEILDVTRVEAGGLDLHLEPVDPVALVDEVVALHRVDADRKGLRMLVAIDPALPSRLQADPRRLGEVVSNLLGNAVRFTERGHVRLWLGPVGVADDAAPSDRPDAPAGPAVSRGPIQPALPAPEVSPPTVRLVIADTGPGIPAADLDRVFEPFFQADRTTARRHGGVGLGLTLTHRLVELMGGRIEVHSTEGGGTRFDVMLPLLAVPASVGRDAQALPPTPAAIPAAAPEPLDGLAPEIPVRSVAAAAEGAPAAPAPPEILRIFRLPPPGSSVGGDTVLVVEDDPVGARIAVSLLRRAGWSAVVAVDGPSALRALGDGGVALVLMDVQLPGMDGCAVTRELRRRERVAGSDPIPVVALSADAYEEARQACAAAGMDGHLSKPYRAADLQQVLDLWAPRPSPGSAASEPTGALASGDLHPNRNRASTEAAPARP